MSTPEVQAAPAEGAETVTVPTDPVETSPASAQPSPEAAAATANPTPASTTDPVVETLAAQAAVQSPAEPQSVPEQRPQGSTQPSPSHRSATDVATPGEPAHGQAEYDAAAPTPENEAAAQAAGRIPSLIVGQRVQVTGGKYQGRMALVTAVIYTDPVQEMMSRMGGGEARFATVRSYILLTRDGRSDTIVVEPENLSPLEPQNGWGRGSI